MNKIFAAAAVAGVAAAGIDQPIFDGELLLTIELCVHGERQSSKDFEFAKDPAEEWTIPSNLTEAGA